MMVETMTMTADTFLPGNRPNSPLNAPPYPPSWVDRFTDWIDQRPLPRWVCYGGLWLALWLPYAAAKWWDGTYPVGTLNGLHLLITGTGIYLLALMHYLRRLAGHLLQTFRPVLTVDDQTYAQLAYQFTTLPARRTFWIALVAGLWFGPSFLYNRPRFPQLQLGTSPLALGLELLLFCFVWGIVATFIYHTWRQLRLVHTLYTQYTHINLFQLGPLYAFSRLTAHTAIGITLINYAWAIPLPATKAPLPGPEKTIFFALVAVVAFLWPLLGVHQLLFNERQRLQTETMCRLATVFAELDRRVDSGDLGEIRALKTAIDTLTAKQAVLAKISTWPWLLETARSVVTTAALPLLIWLTQRLVDLFVFAA
jgi:hypothetical protein